MKPWQIITVALLAVGIIAGALYAANRAGAHAAVQPVAIATTSEEPSAAPARRTPPRGFQEYHSDTYHFSLFYPDSLSVKEYKEQGTALTVTFQAKDGSEQGFQIFIVPYGEQTVSSARLKQDIPSGVIDQQTQIVVDGKPATMFFSTNAALGDTREVWFINHGFLYEVTTYKELDPWLASIMQTWKFE